MLEKMELSECSTLLGTTNIKALTHSGGSFLFSQESREKTATGFVPYFNFTIHVRNDPADLFRFSSLKVKTRFLIVSCVTSRFLV